jgi:hypothetical protein
MLKSSYEKNHAYISIFYVLTSRSMENRYSYIVCIKTNFDAKMAIYDTFLLSFHKKY